MSEYDALLGDASPTASQYDALLDDGELGPIPKETSPPESIAREPIEVVGNPEIPADEAFKIGAGQGAFGLGDEISAGLKAVRDTAASPQRDWENTLQLYQAYKKNAARDRASAQKQQPGAYMAGNLPVAAAMGVTSAALAPAAALSAAPWGTNLVTNMGQSIAQNFGQDTLTPGNVATDLAIGEAVAMPSRVAAAGPSKLAGQALQLPQRGLDAAADWFGGTKVGQVLGANADDIGNMASKRVKDLRVAQESYLTDAGKQGAAMGQAIGGEDLPSRLAKATTEGRASVGPGVTDYTVNPAEFGKDIQGITDNARANAIRNFGGGKVPLDHEDPISFLKATGHQSRASDLNRAAVREIRDEETEMVSNTKKLLDNWQAAKVARDAAQSGATQSADTLQRIKTGRGALQNIAGMAAGGAAGQGVGGPAGALLGIAGGKQLGKGAFQTIDLAGEAGQRLSQVASIAERLATGGGPLGKAAQWALSGQGPAFIARLATLADLPEVQSELLNVE